MPILVKSDIYAVNVAVSLDPKVPYDFPYPEAAELRLPIDNCPQPPRSRYGSQTLTPCSKVEPVG